LAAPGLFEEKAELALRFSDPFAQAIRTLPHEEGNVATALAAGGGKGPGHQGFARARGTGGREGGRQGGRTREREGELAGERSRT
jgi:hypothetical protein